MKLTSTSFRDQGEIPREFTCEGRDCSPQLGWRDVPAATRTLALIVDDPDAPDPAAPQRVWVHWVLYNIPREVTELPADVDVRKVSAEIVEGTNDWRRTGYGGPCPPIGRHRYFFKLYALDCRIEGRAPLTATELEQKMQGHVLATATLMGTYAKVSAHDEVSPAP